MNYTVRSLYDTYLGALDMLDTIDKMFVSFVVSDHLMVFAGDKIALAHTADLIAPNPIEDN